VSRVFLLLVCDFFQTSSFPPLFPSTCGNFKTVPGFWVRFGSLYCSSFRRRSRFQSLHPRIAFSYENFIRGGGGILSLVFLLLYKALRLVPGLFGWAFFSEAVFGVFVFVVFIAVAYIQVFA